jgi:hypothetical protein
MRSAFPSARRVSLAVESLEPRWVPSSSEYVTGLYTTLLHRTPQLAELNPGVAELQAGVPPGQLAQQFTTSPEFQADVVLTDYQTLLGRTAGSAEVAYWVNALRAGLTEKQLAASFLGSAEMFRTSGSDPGPWLAAVYQEVLGRAPDPSGLAYFQQALSQGRSRSEVALAILDSAEANARAVTSAFQSVLGRGPDPQGLAYWTAAVNQGLTPGGLLARLASSSEFIALKAHGVAVDAPVASGSDPLLNLGFDPGTVGSYFGNYGPPGDGD